MNQWHDRNSSKLQDFFFLSFYRFLFIPLFMMTAFLLAAFGHRKVRAGLKMRWPRGDQHPWFDLPKRTQPVWIHASSGEFEYAKPIITRIKAQFPNEKILVTYFSPTYKKNIENFPGVDMSCPLPWDTPGVLSSFIKHHLPKALLISRTDLWPELLYQMRKRNLPTLLFSATLNKPKNFILKPLWQWIFQQLSLVYCVSQEDKNQFLDMGISVVEVIGDTRYDQVLARLEKPKPIKDFLSEEIQRESTILVAGSTWTEDESVIIESTVEYIDHKKLHLILAPHEPTIEHLNELQNKLTSRGLEYQLYSSLGKWLPGKVLIIDTVGILAELYTLSDFAFVGGSFKKSVHSVMEPLAAGCITFVGPYHHNNREALEFKTQYLQSFPSLNIVNEALDSENLRRVLYKALEYKSQISEAKKEIINKVKEKTGASDKILSWLKEVL